MKKLVIRTKLEFEECFFDNFEEIIDGNEYLGCLDVVSKGKYLHLAGNLLMDYQCKKMK